MKLASWNMATRCGLMLLVVAVICGCDISSLPRNSVSGVVTADGVPIEGASVMFVPVLAEDEMGRRLPISHGVTDVDGRYELSMPGGRSGAVIGQHRVMISKREPVLKFDVEGEADSDPAKKQNLRLPLKSSWMLLNRRSKRELLNRAYLLANPYRSNQPFEETIFDSFNRDAVLTFKVKSGQENQADFEVGRDPLLAD